jgi:hypothetical protein
MSANKKKEEVEEELIEHRFTFTCMLTETDRVETRVRAYCFEQGILVDNFEGIGGMIKDRTYGVRIRGTKAQITAFKKWWAEHQEDLCRPSSFLGLVIQDYL